MAKNEYLNKFGSIDEDRLRYKIIRCQISPSNIEIRFFVTKNEPPFF